MKTSNSRADNRCSSSWSGEQGIFMRYRLLVRFCQIPRQWYSKGNIIGGLLMTVADSAAAFALMTLTGPETKMTTTDMNIRFLAPCLTDLIARAKVIKQGRTLSLMAVDLFDENGKHVAVSQVSYFVLGKMNQ